MSKDAAISKGGYSPEPVDLPYEIGYTFEDPQSHDSWRVIGVRNQYLVQGKGEEFKGIRRWATAEEIMAGIDESVAQELEREQREGTEAQKEIPPLHDRWKDKDEIVDVYGNGWVIAGEPRRQYLVADITHHGGESAWLTSAELAAQEHNIEVETVPLRVEDLEPGERVWANDKNGRPVFGAQFIRIEPNGGILVSVPIVEERRISSKEILDILGRNMGKNQRLPEGWKLKGIEKNGDATMYVSTGEEKTIPRESFLSLNKEVLHKNGGNGASSAGK